MNNGSVHLHITLKGNALYGAADPKSASPTASTLNRHP